MSTTSDLNELATTVAAEIGGPPWPAPDGYPNSLALCVLDSVWSLGVRYSSVVNVVTRYRELRSQDGGNADTDGAGDLIAAFNKIGDAEAVADALGNHQLTSTRSGVLKSLAVREVAQLLKDRGIDSVADLVSLDEAGGEDLKAAWRSVKGQGSALSLTYCRMLAGAQDVKADRMIIRFVSEATGAERSSEEARSLLNELAKRDYDGDATGLDHAIWLYQRDQSQES